MKLDDLIGNWVGFCGVGNTTFCVALPSGERVAFEAVEDPSDGYRSCLGDLKSVPLGGLIFFAEPIADLEVKEAPDLQGHQLVGSDGHVWLRVGTDNFDDYYPMFTFEYDPPREALTSGEKRSAE